MMEDPIMMQVDKTRALSDQAKMRLDAARKAGMNGSSGNPAIDKAAQEFEAVFLAQMMEHMFAEVELSPGSEGPGEDIYKTLLLDEYSKLISRSGGIGVADHVKREMLRIQENGAEPSPTPSAAPSIEAAAAQPKNEEIQ